MKKFKLLTTDGYNNPDWKLGQIYDENFSAVGADYNVKELAGMYPQDWEEVVEEKVTLTDAEKEVLIDFLNEHFDEFCAFINISEITSMEQHHKLKGLYAWDKVSNLIDKIERL